MMRNMTNAGLLPIRSAFDKKGFWPEAEVPYFDSSRRLKVLTPFGWFVICAAGATLMGAALAFAV